MKSLRYVLVFWLTLVLTAVGLNVQAAAHAANVVYAFGQVQSVGASGKGRALRKGDQVFPGETVSTARGRAQVQFTDGGFASLQPNTQYRIDDYNYSGRPDGKERSFLSLIKGSVRLVTGVIGRANRNSFRLKTRVATIGIRGTTGKVTHCDAECGNLPVGTQMQGYGGVWDLVSGSFSGPVAAGDAYLCDGATCAQIQGGVAQREEVSGLDAEEEEEREDAYQQGQQVDDDGVQCGLGGNCGDTEVLVNQVIATASQGSPGDTGADENVVLVLQGGRPIAGFTFGDGGEDPDIAFATIDANLLQAAITAFGDTDVSSVSDQLFTSIDSDTLDTLASMPANVADVDFGVTTDDILTFGRWTDGYVLDAEVFLDSEVIEFDLRQLTGFQSEHFIYGPDPGELPTNIAAIYDFSGGTFSTATDGSSIGLGATAGQLTWDFAFGSGAIDMRVEHETKTFDVAGSLEHDGSTLFAEDAVTAISAGTAFPVSLRGFFAQPNEGGAPLAAGLGYAIDLSEVLDYDVIGVAGFALSSTAASTPGTPGTPIVPVVPSTNIAVAYAVNHDAFPGMTALAHAGGESTAFGASIATSPLNFTSSVGDVFDQGSATNVQSGSFAPLQTTWNRFSPGFNFTSPTAMINSGTMSGIPAGDFHAIYTSNQTLPSVVDATTGAVTYSDIAGATSPTLFAPLGVGTQLGTLDNATFAANFTTGTMDSINLSGTFPDGNWSLNASAAPLANGFAPLTGSANFISSCGGTCPSVAGTTVFGFTGDTPEGVVFSFQGNAFGAAAWSGVGIVTPTVPSL